MAWGDKKMPRAYRLWLCCNVSVCIQCAHRNKHRQSSVFAYACVRFRFTIVKYLSQLYKQLKFQLGKSTCRIMCTHKNTNTIKL